MKKAILFLLLFSSVVTNAQSLKEALFGGKLRSQPGTVIRKGDDLTAKVDTVAKTASVDSTLAKDSLTTIDSLAKKPALGSVTADGVKVDSVAQVQDAAVATDATTNTVAEKAAAPKDNNALWKEFVTSVTNTLKEEVLTSKKIKKGSYYVTVSYVIETDGQLEINKVSVTPENAFLQQQVKGRLSIDTPKLIPTLNSAGTPRKVNKNYNFTLTKD